MRIGCITWSADLLGSRFAGMGGPNLLPPDDSPVAAAVMASPGGPAHVMLTDRQAEHIPGCNMAFYQWVLQEVGGFDPVFRKAGDDVDLLLAAAAGRLPNRVQPRGVRLALSTIDRRRLPEATAGYGQAEALLVRKTSRKLQRLRRRHLARSHLRPLRVRRPIQPPVIYHGLFGSAGFQKLYASEPAADPDAVHQPGIPVVRRHPALDSVRDFSPASPAGNPEPGASHRNVRRRRSAGEAAGQPEPDLVPAPGRVALFPAAHRARVGALPRTARAQALPARLP